MSFAQDPPILPHEPDTAWMASASIDLEGLPLPRKLPERALLTLWNPETDEAVIFDPPPRELRDSTATTSADIQLDDFGTVTRTTGRAPAAYTFSGVFYGTSRAALHGLVITGRYRPPSEWRWLLQEFHRTQQTRVQALELHLEGWDIPPFIKPVDISSLEFAYRGGSGDLHYSITLTEHRYIQVGVEGVAGGEGESATSDGEAQPDIPATVTVRDGDYLTSIAKEYLGNASRWQEIAELNGITDEQADWLDIGTVLKLPGGVAETEDFGTGGPSDFESLDGEEER